MDDLQRTLESGDDGADDGYEIGDHRLLAEALAADTDHLVQVKPKAQVLTSLNHLI